MLTEMNNKSFENLLPEIRTKAQNQSLDHTEPASGSGSRMEPVSRLVRRTEPVSRSGNRMDPVSRPGSHKYRFFATKRSEFARSSDCTARDFGPPVVFLRRAVMFRSRWAGAWSAGPSLCPQECWTVDDGDGWGKSGNPPRNGSRIRSDNCRSWNLKSGLCMAYFARCLIRLQRNRFSSVFLLVYYPANYKLKDTGI